MAGEYAGAQCSGGVGGGDGRLGQLFGGEDTSPGAFPGYRGPTPTVAPAPAEVLTLLDDGPAGTYEQC
jgi:hypothetical protein